MRRSLAAAALVLAGCAAPPHARVASLELPGVRTEELRRASDEIRRLDAELEPLAVQSTAAPACARVTQLRDNICALAARICDIAAQQPAGSNAAINAGLDCADGKTRCKRAGERAQARGCPAK